MAIGILLILLAFFGYSEYDSKNKIKHAKELNKITINAFYRDITTILELSAFDSLSSSFQNQTQCSHQYNPVLFSIYNGQVLIHQKPAEFSDDFIINYLTEVTKDTITDSINLSIINIDGNRYMSILYFKNLLPEIKGLLLVHPVPIDSLLIRNVDETDKVIICALKYNDIPIIPASISKCLSEEILSNLFSVNENYTFTCETEGSKTNYAGSNTDINISLRISCITTIERKNIISRLIFFLGLSILITAFILILKGRKPEIGRKILEINKIVESLSKKEFDQNLPDNYDGELGVLAKSINNMSNQLKEIYRDLEIRVIRRTSEISMRNAELRKTHRSIVKQNLELSSAYEALKESREQYEKLIQHLEEEYIFFSQSINGDILFVSPSVTKILGYEVQEYRKLHDTIYTDNPINLIAKERTSNSRLGIAQPNFLKEIYNKEGQPKILEVSEVPIYNEEEKLVSIEVLAHDITEKQKAEELIKEQEEKYRMLFTHASDIIFLYEVDIKAQKPGKIIEANNFMIEKMGYSADELKQKNPTDLMVAQQSEDEPTFNMEFQANDYKYERIWETKTGETINVEISSHAFTIKNKNVAISVARDITERKQVEDEIRFINEELYNQNENLEALVDNLTQTQEQLVQSEKMAALGQLVAGIAHEINTPLGAIKASIGNLSDSLQNALGELPSLFQKQSKENLLLFTMLFELSRKKSPELSSREKRQVKKDISNILKENGFNDPDVLADTLIFIEIYEINNILIENLKISNALQVVRSARNFISLVKNTNTINLAVEKATKTVFALKKYAHRDTMGEKISTDLIDSIETILTLYNNQLRQGVEVVRNYEKLPLIPCYQDEISQVWTNLVQNAIQAMRQVGQLIITTKIEGDMVKISFKDSGSGITPDIMDKIFEPFFTTKKQGEGSGLGLDIVKKIIEKHDGTIYVESTVGQGANFIIKLPLK